MSREPEAQVWDSRVQHRPKNPGVTTHQLGVTFLDDLGLPSVGYEKSLNFKPVPKVSEIMEICPKDANKHQQIIIK